MLPRSSSMRSFSRSISSVSTWLPIQLSAFGGSSCKNRSMPVYSRKRAPSYLNSMNKFRNCRSNFKPFIRTKLSFSSAMQISYCSSLTTSLTPLSTIAWPRTSSRRGSQRRAILLHLTMSKAGSEKTLPLQ